MHMLSFKKSSLFLLAAAAIVAAPAVSHAQIDNASYVQPIDWTRYNGMFGVQAGDTFGQGLVSVLQNESRYELTTIPGEYSVANNGSGAYYNAFTNYSTYSYEQSVRPLSGFAYGTAALIATGTYSPTVGGMSQAAALNEVEMAIRGVALVDRANKASTPHIGGAGTTDDKWEAAYWIAQASEVAYLVWNQLSPNTRTLVANMVIDEANAFNNYTVPYWANPNGSINTPGDTKAEENAWNGHMLAVAQAMMPTNPNASAWNAKASELQVSAFSRPSDVTSTTVVDGKQVQQWLHGYNTFQNGVLVNHNIVHPDYLVSAEAQYNSIATLSLAHQYIPQSTVFNANVTYSALTQVQFTPGADTLYGTGKTIVAPGGTIFYRTAGGGYTASIYYPEGTDWTTKVTDGYLNTDVTAEMLGLDVGKGFDAMGWAQARVTALQALQARNSAGNIYQPGDWNNNYHGTDEVIYESDARTWVQWWLMQHNQISPIGAQWGVLPAPEPGVATLALSGGLAFGAYALRRKRRR